jgi:hypothetical protein
MTDPLEDDRRAYRGLHITTRSKAGAAALAIAVIALGGIVVLFGLMLLVALAGVATLVGATVMAYHRLTGRWPRLLRRADPPVPTLDPSLEVFPGRPDGERHNDRLPPAAR